MDQSFPWWAWVIAAVLFAPVIAMLFFPPQIRMGTDEPPRTLVQIAKDVITNLFTVTVFVIFGSLMLWLFHLITRL